MPSDTTEPAALSAQSDDDLLRQLRSLVGDKGRAGGKVIRELAARGHMNINEIAEQTGIPTSTAYRWAKKAESDMTSGEES